MKKIPKNPFRTSSSILKKEFITAVVKLKKEHILILPNEVVKAFDLQIGDIAIFESSDKCVKIKFVKKSMFSFVEELDIEKLIKNKEAEFSFISGNIKNEAIVFVKNMHDKMDTH